MAEFDAALVSTRSVAWNDTDRSVHYGDAYVGVLTLNPDHQYDCVVQTKDDKQEISTVQTVEAGALRVAYHYWLFEQQLNRSRRQNVAAPVRAAANAASVPE